MSHKDLAKLDTRAPKHLDQEAIEAEFIKIREEIIELQEKFYADGRHSLLIILQGLDASGKDGTIRHVFYGVNPLGIRVYPYGKPTDEEYHHDFLWRLHSNTPKKGMISIFNRSQYEDILVPTVEGYIDKKTINKRYQHVNNFEELLTDEGTVVLKFFLHMSKDVQRERLDERMSDRKKNWKYHQSDEETRKKWDDYMKVYEEIFKRTDTEYAPWHIVPTDDKWYKVYLVAKVIRDTLKDLDLRWPDLITEK